MGDLTADLLSRIESLEVELGRLKTLARTQSAVTATTDAAVPRSHEGASAEPSSSRRDLLRYGVVALGAAAAGMVASPAEAADGGPVLLGSANTATETTWISTGGSAFHATCFDGTGVWGASERAIGTYGYSGDNVGVFGYSGGKNQYAVGVYGYGVSPTAAAIVGYNSGGGNAVRAEVPVNVTSNAIALYRLELLHLHRRRARRWWIRRLRSLGERARAGGRDRRSRRGCGRRRDQRCRRGLRRCVLRPGDVGGKREAVAESEQAGRYISSSCLTFIRRMAQLDVVGVWPAEYCSNACRTHARRPKKWFLLAWGRRTLLATRS